LTINELYEATRGGQKSAENNLFRQLSDSFGLLVRRKLQDRADGEEIVQEALAAIARQYRSIDIEVSFSAWAYRVLENKILDYYRKKRRTESREDHLDESVSNGTLMPRPGLRQKLLKCLRRVGKQKASYVRVLNLHHQGYSTDEICSRLNISRNAMYIVLSRARKALRECLDKEIDS
jgi:RNA polymerase sigma-70 factor (ECF subfamily)